MWGNKSVAFRWPRFFYWASLLALSLLFPQLVSADEAAKSRPLIEKLPLSFELNQGQTDARVKFLSRGNGYAVFLTPAEMVLGLTRPDTQTTQVLRMRLTGANQEPQISGKQELPGKVNYLIGNDAAQWRAGVPTYARVEYGAVYPGIDLVFYGNGRTIEYDFVVAPGADPEVIGFAVEGAEKLALDATGDLVLQMAGGELRMLKPVVYQEVDGVRTPIAGNYVLKGANSVGFQVAAYDASRELVIDPVLVYSTFLGGSGTDEGLAIAADGGGNVYVTGSTQSSNFPLAAALSTSLGGNTDAFITKFSSTGGVLFSTYLGGGGPDQGRGIAVDSSGIYVTGFTQSSNFPTSPGAYTASSAGSIDAFIVKLALNGTTLGYSTFLGGKNVDQGNAIAVGSSVANAKCAPAGCVYVTGSTTSSGPNGRFPTTSGAFNETHNGRKDSDAFVAVLNPTSMGSAQLVYATFLGSNKNDSGNGIALDASGNFYVAEARGPNAFVTKFLATGAHDYSTDLGAGIGNGIAVGSGSVYVTGSSGSSAFVRSMGGPWTNTLAGAVGKGIAVDGANVYVTGSVSGEIVGDDVDATFRGGASDAFVAKYSSAGTRTSFTYLGGSGNDVGNGLAVKAGSDIAYVVGTTASANFPTSVAAFDATCGDAALPCSNTLTDAFVTAVNLDPPPTVTINQAALPQRDPTKRTPINFTVVFSEPVTGFDGSDVSISGTAGWGTKTVVVTGSGPTYNAAVSGMTTTGSVIASIEAGKANDSAGNPNKASTSTDNTVTWVNAPPIVTLTAPLDGSTTNPTPGFSGVGGTIDGDLDTVTVKVYSGDKPPAGAPEQTLTATRDALTGTYLVSATTLPDGKHTAQAQQSDVIGNTGTSLATTFTVDGKLPAFGPVSNLLFKIGTQFSYPAPTAIDAVSGPLLVTCVPAAITNYTAGSEPFLLGTSIVTCTATDTAGNVGSVQFTVTVTETDPPTLGLSVGDVTVAQGAPIVLTATVLVPQATTTIAPDCVNTTWTIKFADGSVVPPRHRERIYGIPNDLVTISAGGSVKVSCDITALDSAEVVDPVILAPGVYRIFATYSNYISDPDCTPALCPPPPDAYDVWTGSVNSNEAELTVDGSSIRVGVDIEPGIFPNNYNCSPVQGSGNPHTDTTQILPVAVLGSETFSVADVNVASVWFGKTGKETKSKDVTATDVNGDGRPDLVFTFHFQKTGISCDDEIPAGQPEATVYGILTGKTNDQVDFNGSDSIRLIK